MVSGEQFFQGLGLPGPAPPHPPSLLLPRLGPSGCASRSTASRELTRVGKTRPKLPEALPRLLLSWQLRTHLLPSSRLLPLPMAVTAYDTFLGVPWLLEQRQG